MARVHVKATRRKPGFYWLSDGFHLVACNEGPFLVPSKILKAVFVVSTTPVAGAEKSMFGLSTPGVRRGLMAEIPNSFGGYASDPLWWWIEYEA